MRVLYISLGLLLMTIIFLACTTESRVSDVRRVEPFSSIRILSAAAIHFTQGDVYSLKVEGKESSVKNTTTITDDGCLVIGSKEGTENKNGGVVLYLTAPDLKSVDVLGVSSLKSEMPLQLEDIKFHIGGVGKIDLEDLTCRSLILDIGGVGKVNVHVDCERVDVHVGGTGRVTLSGHARQANISKTAGKVNTRGLKIGE